MPNKIPSFIVQELDLYLKDEMNEFNDRFIQITGDSKGEKEIRKKLYTYLKSLKRKKLDSVEENLVINLREMDCTTFAENCLAISRTIKSGEHTIEKFANELQKIRYRNGEIDGYVSRLHYFSDWIFDNNKKQVIKSISKEIGGVPYSKQINFMSTHPRSYIQLKNNPKLVQEMVLFEKVISERKVYFIKKENLSQFEPLLQEGDIVGITTGITGLDVVHVGILVKKSGRIHLLHASSDAKKVVVSQNTLEDYLLQNKSATGVILARPLDFNTP